MFRQLSALPIPFATLLLCILLTSFGVEQSSLAFLDSEDDTEWVTEESIGEGQKDAETENVETTDDNATRDVRLVAFWGLKKRLHPLTWRASAVHVGYWLRYCTSMVENTWRGYIELMLDIATWREPVYLLLHKLTYYF